MTVIELKQALEATPELRARGDYEVIYCLFEGPIYSMRIDDKKRRIVLTHSNPKDWKETQ